jgi:hypothetical protein
MAQEIEDTQKRGSWSHHDLPDLDDDDDAADLDALADFEYDTMEGDLMMDAADITVEIRDKAAEIGIHGFDDNQLVIRVFDMLKKAYLLDPKPTEKAAVGTVNTSKLIPNKKMLARLN